MGDGDGTIDQSELIAMARYIRARLPRSDDAPIPDVSNDKDGWFEYFDEDHSGTLEKGEVIRALIKTFRLSSDLSKVEEMRQVVAAVWPMFDPDGSESIDRAEFLDRDGLADTV